MSLLAGGVQTREVVLDDELPRLKLAAVVMLVALVPFLSIGFDLALNPVTWQIVHPFLAVAAVVIVGAVGVLRVGSPLYRRIAFLGAAILFLVLVTSLFVIVFAAELPPIALVAYLLRVVVTAGVTWSVYVLWPMVEVRPA